MQTNDIRFTRVAQPKPTSAKAAPNKTAQPESTPEQTDLVNIGEAAAPGFQPDKQAALETALGATVAANLPPTVSTAIGTAFKSGFVEGYLSPTEIKARCLALQKEFPHLVEVINTGIKTHGYDGSEKSLHGSSELFYLRIGPQTEDRDSKVGIFQYKAPHARERVPAMAMTELAEQLVRNYDPDSKDPKVQENTKLLDDLDIFISINTNPDGSRYVIHDDPMWRKNRAPIEGTTEKGVDINRNYPYEWQKADTPLSEADTPEGETFYRDQTYSGTGPASEAETQAVLKVTKDHPNIMFVVDWHAYGEEIRRPLGVSPADNEFYDEMHGRVKKAMFEATGNEYEAVVSQVTKGTSDDHFYKVENSYSTVMETGKTFIPEESEALVVMEESVAGAREFLKVASDYQKDLNG